MQFLSAGRKGQLRFGLSMNTLCKNRQVRMGGRMRILKLSVVKQCVELWNYNQLVHDGVQNTEMNLRAP
jgi:hypothetical protein